MPDLPRKRSKQFSDGLKGSLKTPKGRLKNHRIFSLPCARAGRVGERVAVRRTAWLYPANIAQAATAPTLALPRKREREQARRSGIDARQTPATKNVGHQCPTYSANEASSFQTASKHPETPTNPSNPNPKKCPNSKKPFPP